MTSFVTGLVPCRRRLQAARPAEAAPALRAGDAARPRARHGALVRLRSAPVRHRRARPPRCAQAVSFGGGRRGREPGLRRGLLVVDRRRAATPWTPRCEVLVLMLGDQPGVTAETRARRCSPAAATRPSPSARTPTGAGIRSRSRAACFAELRSCTATRPSGSCSTATRTRPWTSRWTAPIPRDVDTWDGLRANCALASARGGYPAQVSCLCSVTRHGEGHREAHPAAVADLVPDGGAQAGDRARDQAGRRGLLADERRGLRAALLRRPRRARVARHPPEGRQAGRGLLRGRELLAAARELLPAGDRVHGQGARRAPDVAVAPRRRVRLRRAAAAGAPAAVVGEAVAARRARAAQRRAGGHRRARAGASSRSGCRRSRPRSSAARRSCSTTTRSAATPRRSARWTRTTCSTAAGSST